MRDKSFVLKIFVLLLCATLASCGGLRTFHEYARAGDTIAVPVGMQPGFNVDNITVTITPSSGPNIVLDATDTAIRGMINFYPDPISNMILSRETGINLSPGSKTYAQTALTSANNDKDYYQTTLFLDLPAGLPTGLTQVEVSNGTNTHAATLDIIPGTGSPNTFKSDYSGTGVVLNPDILWSLARAPHTEVTFETLDPSSIPYAIEVNISYTPGSGTPFVVNPLGYRKSLNWSDDGNGNLKIILMQSKGGIIDDLQDYKIYLAGTATGYAYTSGLMFDIDGNEVDYDEDSTPDILTVNFTSHYVYGGWTY